MLNVKPTNVAIGNQPISAPRRHAPELLNRLSGELVDSAMRVHSRLGPGLLESTYEACLAYELRNRGLTVAVQVPLPVVYDSVKLDAGYRIDLLLENLLIVEVKSAEAIAPIHEAQLLTYLKLSGKTLGLLLNFNVVHMRDGIHSVPPRPLR